MIDETISHFRVIEKLGEGGMGVVYKAIDTRLDRPVALKFLPDKVARDAQALERFRREARAASALNHPGICTIYDIGEHDGRAFIAMEFIDGETLRSHIGGKALPIEETLKLGIQIAEALDAAHSEGIIHRDIKPANIFVTKRGQAKVLDFGLAKLVRKGIADAGAESGGDTTDSTSILGIISGTPAYMSPEQVRGDSLDGRTDIYSLGLLLYEMATGRQAFNGSTGGVIIEAVLTRSPVAARSINPDIPPRLEEIISKALDKDREQRYQHAAEVRAELQQLERGSDSGWRTAGAATESSLISSTGRLRRGEDKTARDSTGQTSAPRTERVSRIIDSIAVLPFENASRDAEHEYLGDGIAGSLINILATIPKLRVMAQSTVFRYKGRGMDAQAVGRELNVRAVLTGRIMQSGGALRIGTELVDVATGSQLWGGQYDRKPGDIFSIQDEISNEISEKLRLKLTRAEKKRLTKRETVDAEAYRLYLKGRHHWNKWTEEGFYKAIEYFQQAVEKDPSYALAYTGVADSYVLLGWNSYLPPKDAFPKAKRAAMGALRLDPDLGEAHTSEAAVLWLYDWRWPEAESEFKRSLALSPSHPTASHWYAESLMTMGRHEAAIAQMKKSQELDPLSLIISVAIGWAFYMGRKYDEAIEQFGRTVELDPNYPVTYWILGLVLRKMGRYEQAITEGEKGVRLSGGSPLMNAALAQTLAAAGAKDRALQILDELTKLATHKYVAPYFFAGIHVGLGEADRAIDCLEKAFEEHSHWMMYLHMDPGMDSLRASPRFQDLLGRVGLPLRQASPESEHARL
ncbi:MAG TPA: protein kinase [Candidatus Limnocylindrales bacterium]|nr:protein kinase [Candidatus Limnocylindrales bacterium]